MKVISDKTVLAYADGIILLGNILENITHSLSKLIEASKSWNRVLMKKKLNL